MCLDVSSRTECSGATGRVSSVRHAAEAKDKVEHRRGEQKRTSQSQAAHPNSRIPPPDNSEPPLVQDLRNIHPFGTSADVHARSILRGSHITEEAKIDQNTSIDARSTRNRRMAAAADGEQSFGLFLVRLISSFIVLVLENSDCGAKLLNVAGPNDACWDNFALLLGPVGVHRLLEGGSIVWEDDAVR